MRWQVFHVTPPGFVHARALDEVALSLRDGLRLLGLDAEITHQYLPGFDYTLILGANFAPPAILLLPRENTFVFNLEQISPDSPWLSPGYLQILREFQVWDYSRQNIDALAAMGFGLADHCPIGYVQALEAVPAAGKDIDVLFCGSLNERREKILLSLQNLGLRVGHIFGMYGAERDAYIGRARILLNMHFYQAKVFEMVRVSYLLSNRCFVVTEDSTQPEVENELRDGLVICPYDALIGTCTEYLGKDRERERIAAKGQEIFRRRRQEEYLRPLVNSQ